MKPKVKLSLRQVSHLADDYKVIGLTNSTEWRIGQLLSKKEVDKIILRAKPVEVTIK